MQPRIEYVPSLRSAWPEHRYSHSFPTRRSSDLGLLDDGSEGQRRFPDAPVVHDPVGAARQRPQPGVDPRPRSEEHTSNSSHGYISYAVFCLKKKSQPIIARCRASPTTATVREKV